MTSRFQGGMFNKVRWLVMHDLRPFENELFKIISQDFPFLDSLSIINRQSQKIKQYSSTFITFPRLLTLDLTAAHTDYAIQFLFDKNTSLPRLMDLDIKYETLATVTEGFTNDAARRTCAQIEYLVIQEPFVRPETFFSVVKINIVNIVLIKKCTVIINKLLQAEIIDCIENDFASNIKKL